MKLRKFRSVGEGRTTDIDQIVVIVGLSPITNGGLRVPNYFA